MKYGHRIVGAAFLLIGSMLSGAGFANEPPAWVAMATAVIEAPAQGVRCLGWRNLGDEPMALRLDRVDKRCVPASNEEGPVLFFTWRDAQGVRYIEAVEGAVSGPRSIWQTTVEQGRLRTLNTVRFQRGDGQARAHIVLHQTVLPKPREKSARPTGGSFRPGPPIERRFVYDGQRYRLIGR